MTSIWIKEPISSEDFIGFLSNPRQNTSSMFMCCEFGIQIQNIKRRKICTIEFL